MDPFWVLPKWGKMRLEKFAPVEKNNKIKNWRLKLEMMSHYKDVIIN